MPDKQTAFALIPRGYSTHVDNAPIIEVEAKFILPFPRTAEGLAKAQELLARYFYCKGIDIVASTPNKKRCFYCATLHDEEAVKCESCGGNF